MSGDFQIRLAPEARSSAWNEGLLTLPGSTFYHQHEWARVNRECFGHDSFMLEAVRSGVTVGVLPLTLVSSLAFGRILSSMPFVNYGGPCGTDAHTVTALLDAARDLAREHRANYLELRCAAPLDTDLHCSTRKISMSIPLHSDPEQLWGAFSSKHRTNIRRSYKNGLSVTSGALELLDPFFNVMEHSWRDLGTPLYAKSYFRRVIESFPESIRIFVCSHEGEPVAVALNGHFGETVEGMWAGGVPAARGLQANYALYWEMIQDAARRGYRNYHLGRSTADSGAEDFKRKWNADSRQLYWYSYRPGNDSPPPELNVDNPKYQLAISAWRKLPLWVTRVAGPLISRGIP